MGRDLRCVGEIGLGHKKPKRDGKAKFGMIQRVEEGELLRSVALSNGIQANPLFVEPVLFELKPLLLVPAYEA